MAFATMLMVALSVAGAAQSTAPGSPLQGTAWQLVRFQGGDDSVRTPDDRSKYTVEFGPDGRVAVRFDCNRGAGSWKSSGASQLEFGPMALTRAMCPPESMHDLMVKQWAFVRSYVLKDGHLFLSLMADGGTFEFEPAGAAPAAGGPQAVRYQCGTSEVTATFRGEALDLVIGNKAFALVQTRAASGARYESTGTPAVTFWNKGKVATLTIGASTYPECVEK